MSVYCIAEIGINHNGSMGLCKQLIDVAKEVGANAIKFQKRTIEAVYTPEELAKPRDNPFGSTNGDLKRGLEFDQSQYQEIDGYCAQRGLDWSASCWDRASVEFVAQFTPPFLKIPSALITDMALLRAYRDTGIPLILSTGMSTWKEIDKAVETVRWLAGKRQMSEVTLLHCHAAYPSPLEEINLACIQSLKARYGLPVGYSSHTVSPWPCLMAAVCGAEVVEFHLTLDRSIWGSDQSSSLEPHAAKKLIQEIRTWEVCKGDGEKRLYPSEVPAKAKLRKV